jgi:hypothetical protein
MYLLDAEQVVVAAGNLNDSRAKALAGARKR